VAEEEINIIFGTVIQIITVNLGLSVGMTGTFIMSALGRGYAVFFACPTSSERISRYRGCVYSNPSS